VAGSDRHFSRMVSLKTIGVLAVLLLLIATEGNVARSAQPTASIPGRATASSDVLIGNDIFPESVTSRSDGTLFTGSLAGIIYRALPGAPRAAAWIRTAGAGEGLGIFGVLADERTRTLWACSVPNPFAASVRAARPRTSAVLAFDLDSGRAKGRYPLPAPGGVCNDIAAAADGTVYATDTPNGRILALAPHAQRLRVVGQDERLKGIDGLAFAGDGTLYVNIVTRGALLRVELRADGTLGAITELALPERIAGPDGFRPIGGNRFVLAENQAGRIDEVTITGNEAAIRVLKSGLDSPPGVTLVGDEVYAIEGKIEYLIDPKLKGRSPGPFMIRAVGSIAAQGR